MLSGLEENMVACTCISTNAYTAGNVTSNVYPAGYGRAQDYPHVSIMKTAVSCAAWLLVQQCCTMSSFQFQIAYFNSEMSTLHWKSELRNVWGQ